MLIILAIAGGTVLTRFIPFFLFPESQEPPKIVLYLGKVLPAAMMGLLVAYCLKNISLVTYPYGLPELLAITVIVLLHKWKNNVLLSIGGGTLIYMLLIRLIFRQ
ncbi:hypothetical protein SDC9_138071 [bioreactor metagenome]|uniref:Branched-chain amino acid transport protein AzlD n=1 Tax=bioreactor metagenome TaxID=1076179 RepID=A0A645DPA9_9ZZZZ